LDLFNAFSFAVRTGQVTNETLLHKDPTTGEPQVIGLGWLDDSMSPR
jgi:hypothetical protein